MTENEGKQTLRA